jgi:hypothetical protein
MIEIHNLRQECELNPTTVAIFEVYLPKSQLTMRNVKLNKSKKGTHYIAWPSYVASTCEATQKKNFLPYVSFSHDRQKELEEKILDVLESMIAGALVRYKK